MAPRIGFKHSEETKQKMRLKQLGKNNSFFGKRHKLSTKIKIGESSKGRNLNEKNGQWKGDKVGYAPLHRYIRRHLPEPEPESCLFCKQKKKLHLANMTGIYNREFKNWKYLCVSCHKRYDLKRRKNLTTLESLRDCFRD